MRFDNKITFPLDQLYQHWHVLLFYLFLYKVEDYNFAIMTENITSLTDKITLYILLISIVLMMNSILHFTCGTVTPGITSM